MEGNNLTSTDGDGNVTTNTFDGDGRLLSQVVTAANGVTLSSESDTYDPDGNVLVSTDGSVTTTNTYVSRAKF